MKKFISLVLVALLIFSLSVSAMAAENIPFPEEVDTAFFVRDSGYINMYMFYYHDDSFAVFVSENPAYAKTILNIDYLIFDGQYVRYGYTPGNDYLTKDILTDGKAGITSPLTDANVNIYWEDGSLYYEYTGIGFCNGTSCPAVDVDGDSYCDECGGSLMSLSRPPVAPEVPGNNKQFVMFYTGDTYYYTAYTSDTAYSIRGYNYGTRMRSTSDISVNVQRLTSHDGINWFSEYSGTAKDYYPGEQGWILLSSTFNWYDSSDNTDDPFFPVPLWAEVEKVTQGEMPGMTENLTEVLMILTVLGVGCLALLILLKLFGRRSLIYRG